MRIMGLDVGDKTIGVAVSDHLGITAQGVKVVQRTNIERDFAQLKNIADAYGVRHMVVGLPKNMDGTIGPRAKKCQCFARKAEERLGIPVTLWDERLTTAAAERTLLTADVSRRRRKQVIDKMAAMLILQAFLDAQRRNGSNGKKRGQ